MDRQLLKPQHEPLVTWSCLARFIVQKTSVSVHTLTV